MLVCFTMGWRGDTLSHINAQKAVWRPSRKQSRGLGFPQKWYAGQQSRDTFELICKILFHFIWEFPGCGAKFCQLFCHLVICLVTKKKEEEEEGDHEVWERWKATKWEDRKGIERGKKNVTSHHVWALTSILRTPLCCCQTCEDSHLNYLARADYFPRFLSVADASWLVHLQSRWKGGLKINSSWKFKVRACSERKKKEKKFLLEDLNL